MALGESPLRPLVQPIADAVTFVPRKAYNKGKEAIGNIPGRVGRAILGIGRFTALAAWRVVTNTPALGVGRPTLGQALTRVNELQAKASYGELFQIQQKLDKESHSTGSPT